MGVVQQPFVADQLETGTDCRLQVQRYVRVGAQQGHRHRGQPIAQRYRPDFRPGPTVCAAEEDVIRRRRQLPLQGQPLALPQQIDLQQVRLGPQDFQAALIVFAGAFTAFVRRRKNLDQ